MEEARKLGLELVGRAVYGQLHDVVDRAVGSDRGDVSRSDPRAGRGLSGAFEGMREKREMELVSMFKVKLVDVAEEVARCKTCPQVTEEVIVLP